MFEGKRTIFNGDPAPLELYPREIPTGIYSNRPEEQELYGLLPIEAEVNGYKLISVADSRTVDPVCIYDRYGRIVHQWPENYIPEWPEVFEISKKLGLEKR